MASWNGWDGNRNESGYAVGKYSAAVQAVPEITRYAKTGSDYHKAADALGVAPAERRGDMLVYRVPAATWNRIADHARAVLRTETGGLYPRVVIVDGKPEIFI